MIYHLGYDKNQYISFEIYNILESLGYDIKINKILEYKHSNFMKSYINLLFEKKSYYKKLDKSMYLTYKILMNSPFWGYDD